MNDDLLIWLKAYYTPTPKRPKRKKPMRGRPFDPKSQIGRVRQFFLENDDEELTYDQVSIKFDIARKTVADVAQKLIEAGICESVHLLRGRKKT